VYSKKLITCLLVFEQAQKYSILLGNAQNDMKNVIATMVADIIKDLLDAQKEIVKACVMAANTKPKGRRYSPEWVYECILMRIKSPSLCRRMQREKTLFQQ